MKRSGLLLLGLTLVVPLRAEPPRPAPLVKGPRIAVEPASFDFGESVPQGTLNKEFSIRNDGSQNLVIEKVVTDCGCTAAFLDPQEKLLKPGGTATLRVTLRTGVAPGAVVKRVLIHSNDPARRLIAVQLKAKVVRPQPVREPRPGAQPGR